SRGGGSVVGSASSVGWCSQGRGRRYVLSGTLGSPRRAGRGVLWAVDGGMSCLRPAGCGRRTGRRDRACRARSLMLSEGLLGVLWAVYGGKCCPQPWVPHGASTAAFSGPQTA